MRTLLARAFGADGLDYGYQNNGYFLMMEPTFAERIYADDVFPQIRPRSGEAGYRELGYHRRPAAAPLPGPTPARHAAASAKLNLRTHRSVPKYGTQLSWSPL